MAGPGEEGGGARRGVRVGGGQPRMEGKDRGLESQAENHEHHARGHRAGVGDLAEPSGHVRHVQGAGHHVEQPDPDEEEGRADRAEHEVAERGEQGGASGAEGDQGVGRQRRDLQEDEDVEHVPGDRHAEHPGEAQQPRGVEEPDALAADLARDAEPGVHQRQGARAGHDHQHQGVQRVEPVLDAPRRRPSSKEIGDLRAVRHRVGERRRDREAHPAHRRGESPGEGGIAQQRAQRRREKRYDDLQRGKLRLQGAHRRPASPSPTRCSASVGEAPRGSRRLVMAGGLDARKAHAFGVLRAGRPRSQDAPLPGIRHQGAGSRTTDDSSSFLSKTSWQGATSGRS